MCGVAGAAGAVDREVIQAVRRISEAQRKRGPDASGEWSSSGTDAYHGVFLAHRRLKIIDLSDSANQPMVNHATGHVIAFNGEIYNFKALREELKLAGFHFETSSDTEVILNAYAAWGKECVKRLDGMFAFAIWDPVNKHTFVARDRLGIKPLYFAEVRRPEGQKSVLFASQVRALLKSGLIDRRLDRIGLSTYLWNGFVVGPNTLIEGVRQVSAGCTLTIDPDGQVAQQRYWQIPASSQDGDPSDVRKTLEQSVARHMLSDVPLGVFLSGGKDSSAVATMASRISDSPINTFTITFEEDEYNEAKYARRVADCIKSDHHEVLLTEARFIHHLDDALNSIDQPTFDGINSYLVSQAVKEAGLTVALAGTGGDEVFGGYRSFRDLPWIQQWSRRMAFIPSFVAQPLAKGFSRLQARSFGRMPPQTRWGRFADALRTKGDLASLYQVAYSLFTSDFVQSLENEHRSDSTCFGLPVERLDEFRSKMEGQPVLHGISHMEMSMFLGERLLRDTDAASMEVSLEVRVPLIDHHVVESVFKLEQSRRFEPVREKPLLREMAMWDLPDYIFDRPKLGFELPLDVWCRRGLKEGVGDILMDRRLCEASGVSPDAVSILWDAYQSGAPGLYWSRVWGLYVLLWWCKHHDVSL